MKILKLIQKTPFLLILIIILLLSILNQKHNTRLKILVWNTPYLSLGNYIAISSATGFIFSYIFTGKLANSNKIKIKKQINYKLNDDNEENFIQDNNIYNETLYENNFIERDVKEPSPTLNASFRIISKNNRKKESPKRNQYKSSYFSDESDNKFYEQKINYKDNVEVNSILNDWEDDTYLNW